MKHRVYFGLVAVMLVSLTLLAYTLYSNSAAAKHRQIMRNREMAGALLLTDLALWTEARYTRNPSQADFFTPFQDFPAAVEHFPAGSLVVPPTRSGEWQPGGDNLENYVQESSNTRFRDF